ncbi:MAG TPA: hypothetical protein DCF33_13215 [Saprospirales bacterium]|nr:hypothetical protein [Saprospirales bacterium]
MQFDKLQLLHETITNMETLGLPITDAIISRRKEIEDEIISNDLLPMLSEQIEPILGWLNKEFVIVIDYNPEKGLDVKLSKKARIIEVLSKINDNNSTDKREGSSYRSARQPYTGSRKSPSPDPYNYAIRVPELKPLTTMYPFLTWQEICNYLRIEVGADSARRKLKQYVNANQPHWPDVPEPIVLNR